MSEDFEIIQGSGYIFRELYHPDADREQLRLLLAAQIIGVLAERELTVRAAQELTGIVAADFSRILNVKLSRFTIGRLTTILGLLGQEIDVAVNVHPRCDRRVVAAGELTAGEVTFIAKAEGPPGHACPDDELKDWCP